MKILLLDNSHLPNIGGKEIVVHHLARQYAALGHDVRVSGPAGLLKHRRMELGYPIERSLSIPLLNKANQWRLRVGRILARRSYDVVHAHTTHPCGYYAQFQRERLHLSTPLVITPHGADIHKVPEIQFGKRLDPDLEAKIRWLLERCDKATAISDSVRASLLDAGARPDQIVDIPNGVDAERLGSPVDVDARAYLGLPAGTPLFVSVGNYHPRKGHEVLVEAIARCTHDAAHVVIIGRTNPEFVARANEIAPGRVTFTGTFDFRLPGAQSEPDILAALLQQSTAYVSASMGEGTEGLSLALLEAMAARACPIATSISGNRDVIVDGDNGLLVPPNSATALAAAIDRVCAAPEMARQLGDAAARTVEPYSWRDIALQYLAVYEALARDRAA